MTFLDLYAPCNWAFWCIGNRVPQVNNASIARDGFLILRHIFKMAAMTSFQTEKCCHLVSEQASAGHYAEVSASSQCIVICTCFSESTCY